MNLGRERGCGSRFVVVFQKARELVLEVHAGAKVITYRSSVAIAQPVIQQGLLLALNLIIFTVILLICLIIIRPLDAEDATLLNQVPRWLRRALLPFASRRRNQAPAVVNE